MLADKDGNIKDNSVTQPKDTKKVSFARLAPPPANTLASADDDKSYIKIACDKDGKVTDPNFKVGSDQVPKIYQLAENGDIVEYNKSKPLSTATFSLVLMDKDGKLDTPTVTAPKDLAMVDKVLILPTGKLAHSGSPVLMAKILCDKDGNVIDSNFPNGSKVPEVYQLDPEGNLVKFNKSNPLLGPTFGLILLDDEGKPLDERFPMPIKGDFEKVFISPDDLPVDNSPNSDGEYEDSEDSLPLADEKR